MARYIDMVGQRYGMLTVEELHHIDSKKIGAYWRCICDCGSETIACRNNLITGHTTSCGCKSKRLWEPIDAGDYWLVPLTSGKVTKVSKGYGDIKRLKICAWQTLKDHDDFFYARGRVDGKNITMHRFLMGNPTGMEIDHKNRDGLDNRRSNLRICTRLQNAKNRGPNRGKKFVGVYKCRKNKRIYFRARIWVNKKLLNLGCYKTEEEAAKVRDTAAIEYHGEFARLNFPEEHNRG